MKVLMVYIVFGLAVNSSFAYDMGPFINHEMSKVEGQNSIRDEAGLAYQHSWENLQPVPVQNVPIRSVNPQLQNLEPLKGSELLGAGIDRPQTGVIKRVDPSLAIQNEMAEKDLYQKTRNNYRKAVQREFLRRAGQAGVSVSGRNIAEEIKELEDKQISAK